MATGTGPGMDGKGHGKDSGSKAPLMKRSVVSSFLYKFTEENGQRKAKIALFKRSGKVRTYPHRWAVISGSIDSADLSPQAAAWREIHEETTLTQSSLELMRQGKSYVLPDESIGREWTIYPFAFRLKDASEGGRGEQGITLDWEHEDWAWYDPFEIQDSESFGAVPRLAESLRRVWLEKSLGDDAGAVLTKGLDTLKHDHESGARQMAGHALQILRDIMVKMDTQQPTEEWWNKIRFAAWHLWKNGRESKGAAVLSALLAALRAMETVLQQEKLCSSAAARDALVEALDRCIASRAGVARATSFAFANFLQDQFASRVESGEAIKLLTISESSTITHALRHVVGNTPLRLDLGILESRPLYEGISLANSLIQAPSQHTSAARAVQEDNDIHKTSLPKLRVTLYTDASSAIASQGIDIVLLGAARIAESGHVSNKTGSLPAVLSAKYIASGAKTVVLSELEKVASPGAADAHVVENNEHTQLTRAWEAEHNSRRIRDAAGTVACEPEGGRPVGCQAAAVRVDVRNTFFEWVPADLVDIYVTEHGVATRRHIRELSQKLGTEEERLFRDI